MLQGVESRFDIHINKTLCDLRYAHATRFIFLALNESMPLERKKYSTLSSIFPTPRGLYMIYKYIVRISSPIPSNLLIFASVQDCFQRVDQRAYLVSSLQKSYAIVVAQVIFTPILTNTQLLRLETASNSCTEAPIQDLSSSNTSPLLNVFGS